MNIRKLVIGSFAFTMVAASSTLLIAGEDEITLDKAPAAVQATIKKAVGDNKIEKITMEKEDGKTVYEAEFDVKDVDHTISVAEDGKLLEEETEIEADKLPAAVTEAINKAHAGCKIKEANLVTADGKTYYEVDIKIEKEAREIKLEATGAIISDKEEKTEEKD